MPIEVKMAKLSPTMESGLLVRWLVKVGDVVKEGQTLAEVQTDKATMPMEAFDGGTVAHLDVAEGQDVPLGARVLVLAKKGEDPSAIGKAASEGGGTEAKAAPAKAPAPDSEEAPARAPETKAPAATNGTHAPAPEAQAPAPTGRVKSTPLARKVASKAGVDVRSVSGSGPKGRIVRKDVDAYLAGPKAGSRSLEQEIEVGTGHPGLVPAAKDQRVPLSRMRATIAKRMSEAARTAPVVHLTVDVRLDRVMEAREEINKQLAGEKVKLSVGDFVTKAVAVGLKRHGEMNASFVEDAIIRHGRVNVGIAVAIEGGLIVPVLHDADALGLKAIRQGTEALASAARSGRLSPQQLEGGTFTISNLGMFGTKQFDAILNLPQVGILAVGAGEPRPVVEEGKIVPAIVMSMTITADHRAVDGADAARFLQTVKGLLESPATMLV